MAYLLTNSNFIIITVWFYLRFSIHYELENIFHRIDLKKLVTVHLMFHNTMFRILFSLYSGTT